MGLLYVPGEKMQGGNKIFSLLSFQYACAICCFYTGEVLSHGGDSEREHPHYHLNTGIYSQATLPTNPPPRAGGHHLYCQSISGPSLLLLLPIWMGPLNGMISNVFAFLKKKKGRKGTKAHPGQGSSTCRKVLLTLIQAKRFGGGSEVSYLHQK